LFTTEYLSYSTYPDYPGAYDYYYVYSTEFTSSEYWYFNDNGREFLYYYLENGMYKEILNGYDLESVYAEAPSKAISKRMIKQRGKK
jgi:hypothetical protein